MNIMDSITGFWQSMTATRKPTPADFRRGLRGHVIGMSIDHNSKNRGLFMGDIIPMKRRFKGVSRTAK